MEIGLIIVLALVGIYTTLLVVGSVMETKERRGTRDLAVERGQTAA